MVRKMGDSPAFDLNAGTYYGANMPDSEDDVCALSEEEAESLVRATIAQWNAEARDARCPKCGSTYVVIGGNGHGLIMDMRPASHGCPGAPQSAPTTIGD